MKACLLDRTDNRLKDYFSVVTKNIKLILKHFWTNVMFVPPVGIFYSVYQKAVSSDPIMIMSAKRRKLFDNVVSKVNPNNCKRYLFTQKHFTSALSHTFYFKVVLGTYP